MRQECLEDGDVPAPVPQSHIHQLLCTSLTRRQTTQTAPSTEKSRNKAAVLHGPAVREQNGPLVLAGVVLLEEVQAATGHGRDTEGLEMKENAVAAVVIVQQQEGIHFHR